MEAYHFCLQCCPNDKKPINATGQARRLAHSHQTSQWSNRIFATANIEKSKRSPGPQFLGSHSFELKQAINPGSAGLPGQVTFKALHPNQTEGAPKPAPHTFKTKRKSLCNITKRGRNFALTMSMESGPILALGIPTTKSN